MFLKVENGINKSTQTLSAFYKQSFKIGLYKNYWLNIVFKLSTFVPYAQFGIYYCADSVSLL